MLESEHVGVVTCVLFGLRRGGLGGDRGGNAQLPQLDGALKQVLVALRLYPAAQNCCSVER